MSADERTTTGAGAPLPTRRAKRLTVYAGGRHQVHHRPVAVELVRQARRAGLAGATIFRGQSGFGHSGSVHRTHLVAEDAPETVVLVDRPETIDRFVGEMQSLLAGLLVVVDEVDIVDPPARGPR